MGNPFFYPKLINLYPLKRVIITGAGSGLGLELVKLLLQDGWKICAIDMNTSELEIIKTPALFLHQQDITNRDYFRKIIEGFCEQHQGVDILFNNAGVGEGSFFKDYAPENWDFIININLKAVIEGTHFVLPFMLKSNTGSIVNMASMAGIANLPKMSPYNVTKAAVISLSETLTHELSKTNIRVICVMPTFFKSSIMQHSKGDSTIVASATEIVSNSRLTSKEAADIILRNLHKRKEVLRFPFSANLFFYSRRFFPALFKKAVRSFLMK